MTKREREPYTVTRREHQCPGCGRLNDSLGGPGAPQPGDVVICIACRVYQVVTDDGGVRFMTNREWLALSPEEREHFSEMRERLKDILLPEE